MAAVLAVETHALVVDQDRETWIALVLSLVRTLGTNRLLVASLCRTDPNAEMVQNLASIHDYTSGVRRIGRTFAAG